MKSLRNNTILFVISVSLLASIYCFAKNAVIKGTHPEYKVDTFTSILFGGMDQYKIKVIPAWRPRLLSNLTANAFMAITGLTKSSPMDEFAKRCAAFYILWIAGSFLLVTIFFKNALFFILLFAACLFYTWTPAGELMLLPWDGPSVFFWTAILLLSKYESRKIFIVILGIAMGFKETLILAVLIPLFWPVPWKERIRWFVIAGVVCFIVKSMCGAISAVPSGFFSMMLHYPSRCATGQYWLIDRNVWSIMQPTLNHVIFSAGGILLAITMLPKSARMHQVLAGCYLVSLMLFCVITECRLWNEFIPMFIFGYRSSIKEIIYEQT